MIRVWIALFLIVAAVAVARAMPVAQQLIYFGGQSSASGSGGGGGGSCNGNLMLVYTDPCNLMNQGN